MDEDINSDVPVAFDESTDEHPTTETSEDRAVDSPEVPLHVEQVENESVVTVPPLEDASNQILTGNDDIATGSVEIASEPAVDPEVDREPERLKLDGIEGSEEPPLEHAQLELLSEHHALDELDEVEEDAAAGDGLGEAVDDILMVDDGQQEFSDHGLSPEYRVFDRETLIQQYKDALEERAKIQASNQQFQNKLSEYFKKKKTEERGQEIEKNANDQEQRYMKYMSNLEELQKHEAQQSASIKIQLEEMQRKCTEMEKKVEDASNEFIQFKYETAADSINSRSGKQIPAKDLEQYQASEAKKEQEVIAVRLENIKLKNRLKKREQQLKAKEELAEGLHLIDFEQLKIENQTYHEKIEERNEELLKLRRKITTTVQVLTHLKEKLQFVQGENGEQRSKLRDIEVTVAHKRDILTRLKQVRDALRIDNTKLKHKAGLLGNKPLLKDYEIRKDEGEELQAKLDTLKKQHVDLNLALQGVKKKIDKANPVVHAM